MSIFIVLVKKEIKELLTLQVILSIAAMLLIFQVIGKSVGSQNKSSASRNGVVTVDLDRSQLSERLTKALGEAGYEIKPSKAGSIEAALAAPEHAAENSFILIPAELQKTIDSGRKSRVEFYSRFRKNASGLGPVLAASRTRKAAATVTGELSYHVLERKVPGLPPSFLRNPAPPLEFAVVDGRAEEVPLAQVLAFIQSQTYFFPVAVFFIVILSAQMIMTSVAGEKENKTLETLLSSPIDRRLLVLSKLTASAFIAAALSAAYMLGMRSFMSGITAETSVGAAAGAAVAGPALAKLGLLITPSGYFLIGLSVLFCILCALSIAFILGVLSEDLKSIQAMMTPLMMALMLSYLLPIFIDLSSANFGIKFLLYAIPFTHAFMAPQNMMMGNSGQVLWGIAYQAAIFAVCVVLAARLFSGETLLTLRLKFGRK
ncbi:MAG: ABC transporter permease [Elusimicrobia bacterium]|nr:ABC transporter permease [Elusimicrobiota bacterium]